MSSGFECTPARVVQNLSMRQSHLVRRIMAFMLSLFIGVTILPLKSSAVSDKTVIPGEVYTFDKGSKYEFSKSVASEASDSGNTYGTFSVSGNIENVGTKDGRPSYEISSGKLGFFYNYDDAILNADEDSWHLIDDKSKKIDTLSLSSNIMKGAIVLQTSQDCLNWSDVEIITNAFSNTPNRTSSIYTSKDVELFNGCFYRLIVAYELERRIADTNFLFINTDKYEKKKCAEVYEFYAYMNSGDVDVLDPNNSYRLGERVRVKTHDGYSGEVEIDSEDIHYKWEIGEFYVSGFSDDKTSADGSKVFLKHVGDKVTLWFKLKQNIDGVKGQTNLIISPDTEGKDQYFETDTMDFGRGTLIIRKTDHNNIKSDPIFYTNYLEANATVGADTKVYLCEEGDYEVALDYAVTKKGVLNKIGYYRIFFKFSVRNDNSMFFPLDVVTGSELSNSSATENGFRLDLAGSQYLSVTIKREILKDTVDGLVEDTRFNGAAKNGSEYTEEGIYTITARNEYSGTETTKRIYVGTNAVLRAHMKTGRTISEINELLSQGATISDDGTIQLVSSTTPAEPNNPEGSQSPASEIPSDDSVVEPNKDKFTADIPVVPILGAVAILAIVVSAVFHKKHTSKPKQPTPSEGGGDER